jgi:hypothetical protein
MRPGMRLSQAVRATISRQPEPFSLIRLFSTRRRVRLIPSASKNLVWPRSPYLSDRTSMLPRESPGAWDRGFLLNPPNWAGAHCGGLRGKACRQTQLKAKAHGSSDLPSSLTRNAQSDSELKSWVHFGRPRFGAPVSPPARAGEARLSLSVRPGFIHGKRKPRGLGPPYVVRLPCATVEEWEASVKARRSLPADQALPKPEAQIEGHRGLFLEAKKPEGD